jgi:hypothetical protein
MAESELACGVDLPVECCDTRARAIASSATGPVTRMRDIAGRRCQQHLEGLRDRARAPMHDHARASKLRSQPRLICAVIGTITV